MWDVTFMTLCFQVLITLWFFVRIKNRKFSFRLSSHDFHISSFISEILYFSLLYLFRFCVSLKFKIRIESCGNCKLNHSLNSQQFYIFLCAILDHFVVLELMFFKFLKTRWETKKERNGKKNKCKYEKQHNVA